MFLHSASKQDLIKLLNSDDEDQESLHLDDNGADEIDTNQDYKETLVKIMNQIYCNRERLSKNPSAIVLLLVS